VQEEYHNNPTIHIEAQIMEILSDEHQQLTQQLAEIAEPKPTLFTPASGDPVATMEHYHRYLYASRFVKNKRVLDIASGEGYGAAFLSLNATSVLGVDADAMAIDQAKQKYTEFPNVRFETGNCEDFTAEDHSFDVAVSFETLKRIDIQSQHKFLEQIKKALKPEGVFIVSTPERTDQMVTDRSDGKEPSNDFSGVEFFEFLKQHFFYVLFVGQKHLTVSTMWSPYAWRDDAFRFHVREDLFTLPHDVELFEKPEHLIAICSDEPLPVEIADNSKSVYFDTHHVKRSHDLLAEVTQLRREKQQMQSHIAKLQEEHDQRTEAVKTLNNEQADYLNRINDLQQLLDESTGRTILLEQETTQRAITLEALKHQHDEHTVWADRISREHEHLTRQVQTLRMKLDERVLESATHVEENTRMRDQIARLEEERESYTTQIAESAAQRVALQVRMTELEEQNREQVTLAEANSEEIVRLRDAIAELRSLDDQKISEQQRVMAEKDVVIADLRRYLDEAKSDVDQKLSTSSEIETEIAEKKGMIEKLEHQLNERAILVRNTMQENDKMRAKVAELQKFVEEKAALASKLNAEVDSTKDALEALRNENIRWSKQAETYTRRSEDFETMQRKYEEQSIQLRQIKAEFEKETAAFDTFQKSQADLQLRYNKSQVKVQELQAWVTMMEQKFENISSSNMYKLLSSMGFLPKSEG
jgi:SAM-dependent methyltransferase